MNETVKTPNLAELKSAGYEVDIFHRRAWKIAYIDSSTNQLVVKKILNTKATMALDEAPIVMLYQLLPKGGKTVVTVKDPVSGLDFTAYATCSYKDNYNKKVGIKRCLDRIIGLMLVCEYQDNSFRVRVGT